MHVKCGIEMLEISANVMGQLSAIYPTLVWDNETANIVDVGYLCTSQRTLLIL